MASRTAPSTACDVLIVGGGIAGASLGAAIAARRRTIIIEAESQCGFHATGRSAAFWMESYGGPAITPLTTASRAALGTGGFLSPRGALHISDDAPIAPVAGVGSRQVARAELERIVPGIRPSWRYARYEPGCSDIDVAGLHAAFLAQFRRSGGSVVTDAALSSARFASGRWTIALAGGETLTAAVLVNAAGAWADVVAAAAGAAPLGIAPKRRTMVQLRVARDGLRALPLINDAAGKFYFKGEGDRSLWLSPHDEIDSAPGDAAPEEIDVATAVDRFQQVVDWPVEAVERRWAGLRSFAPDRAPVYGFDSGVPGLFWCAGQGGFGIQTAPAAAKLAAALLLGEQPEIDPAPFSPGRFA
ncbi:FAD-binding oxidoreductase [Sphingomonas sp.]|uniref:NAD(P)/FAD-dependent oxidoreductase n=1 Tax=Sphingomonas sp. TaxID=28214 RepID=UPI00286E7471|nr:FAD-binding oxidoreductase [Sphingomonas sp.]